MKKNIVFMSLIFVALNTNAQKTLIDTSVYDKWPGIGNSNLTAKGTYVSYDFNNHLTIKGLNRPWQITIDNIRSFADFANSDRQAVFETGKDSLCIQTLGTDHQEWIANVSSFQTAIRRKAEWLLYQLHTDDKKLVIRNLATGKQTSWLHVTNYQFLAVEEDVLIQQQSGDSILSLCLFHLADSKLVPLWQGKILEQAVFTADGKGLAFIGVDLSGKKAIWYYHQGDGQTQILDLEAASGLNIDNLLGFDATGNQLFLKLRQRVSLKKRDPSVASVDIYSYNYPMRVRSSPKNASYTYVFNLISQKLTALESRDQHLLVGAGFSQTKNYMLQSEYNDDANLPEWNWNPAALVSVYLHSTKDGVTICLAKNIPDPATRSYQLSPDGKYVIYYDLAKKDYFSYNTNSGVTLNITQSANASWIDKSSDGLPDSAYHVNSDYHWLRNNAALLINDQNDIYQADPSGKTPVICLTGHYGQTHHIRFSLPIINGEPETITGLGQPLLLKAFDEETMEEGFCKVIIGKENMPTGLKMLPCHIGDYIEKSRDADSYILRIETAESAPNLFATTDFKTYRPLTDVHPENSYNWLSSELVNWKLPDGRIDKGILYKPENFDPKKRYPVIFHYYERLTDDLHKYLTPAYSEGQELDIPTYVSNGYLVFEPDIHYQTGHPGQSALNAIESAAEYLKQFPWVDSAHIGLMGHSFGGYETNYVITHSHLFAAAISLSGLSDFMSGYNSSSVYNNGQYRYETGQNRIGATLWQRPDLYIENSPIFNADKVTTPVLIMANKNDAQVPYEQGFELFMALRRLGRKAWLLQYDKGNHSVLYGIIDNQDITLRMRQFFDYFLKGETPPRWMVEGVPPGEKQIDSGLSTDTAGGQP